MSFTAEVHHGDYRQVFAEVSCDAVIGDGPFSEKTHRGFAAGAATAAGERSDLHYKCWSEDDAREWMRFWDQRCSGWIVQFCDHVLFRAYEEEAVRLGRYHFHPIPYLDVGMGTRFCGDGPSSWSCWISVSRPRTKKAAKWRTLQGAYQRSKGDRRPDYTGGKPFGVMCEIVRDYSNPGDLVIDPTCGSGTTLLACVASGRRSFGSDVSDVAVATARERLSPGPLFAGVQ